MWLEGCVPPHLFGWILIVISAGKNQSFIVNHRRHSLISSKVRKIFCKISKNRKMMTKQDKDNEYS